MIVSERQAREAFEALCIAPGEMLFFEGLTKEDVTTIFRRAARQAHPDLGGSPEAFAKIDRAKHILLAWLEKQTRLGEIKSHGGVTVCPRCNGDRRIRLQRGFRQMQVQCPTCQGNGELYDEKSKEGDRI